MAILKATNTPPDKQFCLLIKTLWKNQHTKTIYTLKGYGLEMALAKGIWFWYGIMQNNMSIQEDSIILQNCYIGGCWCP